DLLDDTLNTVLSNGHQVRMGVEIDEWNRPLNYYFKRSNDVEYGVYYTTSHDIVPAADIIHFFVKESARQVRGIPPACAAMIKLHHLNGYAEAEVIAARIEASKTFFYERKESADGDFPGQKNEAGEFTQEIEPGIGEICPDGYTIKTYDPTHPNGNFSAFSKDMLRAVASSWGLSYNTLANDLESVNYSSMRSGVHEEREQFMILQQMLIENFCIPVFEAWLEMALLKGAIALPFNKLSKFNAPQFIGRRWQWVDPLKDVETSKQEMAVGISTLTETLASKGKDIVETFETIKRERELAKEYGIDLTPLASPNFTEAQK
ncbi:MAG: phage portal protein, partial [Spirochaetota bacterium]